MSGMLPIDRVRAVAAKARGRFARERRRFTRKQALLDRTARAYDDEPIDAVQQAEREQVTGRPTRGRRRR